jgi:crotonobetainyl-CoA:carnitine CoA-transferase CaiB-like acyl-CoA transferase
MPGALHGVRVIDFGQYIAGPLAAQLLGDQGAEVIRVDPPGGPAWDHAVNAVYNRGKASIVLDLKTEVDRETARALIASADVVIENFRPGVMDRLGLGAEALTQANPRLIHCSLPGFGPDDPRSGVQAWEGVVGAASGLYRRNRVANEAGAPVYTAIPLASSYAAIQASVAVAMALGARERDGVGQRISVPLFDAMYGAIGYNGFKATGLQERPLGAALSLTTQFECADGNWVMFHTGNSRTEQVLTAAGVASWIEQGYTDRERLSADPELAKRLSAEAKALFKTRPAAEWEALVNDAGGECAVCRPTREWLDHPHALGSEIIVGWTTQCSGRCASRGSRRGCHSRRPRSRGQRTGSMPTARRSSRACASRRRRLPGAPPTPRCAPRWTGCACWTSASSSPGPRADGRWRSTAPTSSRSRRRTARRWVRSTAT